ncbi:MAG: hypothetical protein PUI29_00495 [Aeromonadales bacterium]|nr:hypothetical protein [Aeromonadales bacterium]MDY2890750.1 hypothetical protein [Succinivibrio sp.]
MRKALKARAISAAFAPMKEMPVCWQHSCVKPVAQPRLPWHLQGAEAPKSAPIPLAAVMAFQKRMYKNQYVVHLLKFSEFFVDRLGPRQYNVSRFQRQAEKIQGVPP